MFLVTGKPTPADAHASALAYLRICFVVSSIGAWLVEHKKVRDLAAKITEITSHATIKGKILDVYTKHPVELFGSPVVICADFWNDSPDVSPNVKEFECQVETPEGILTSRAAHRFATDGIVLDRGDGRPKERAPGVNLGHWSHSKLEKHNHREGWLLFMFDGLARESLDGCTMRLIVIDGGGNRHPLEDAPYPWPTRNFRCGISDESTIPEDIE